MIAAIAFEFPQGWLLAVPLGLALAFAIWRQRRAGVAARRIAGLGALRAMALLVLVFLAARPIWMTREPPASATRSVVLLMDRSESMSLEERDVSRYQQALGFLRERLLPALRAASLPVQAMLSTRALKPPTERNWGRRHPTASARISAGPSRRRWAPPLSRR